MPVPLEYSGTSPDSWPITPHDTAAQAPFRALWVGTGGDVRYTTTRGNIVTVTNVPSGSYVLKAGLRVWATGTTASGILGCE